MKKMQIPKLSKFLFAPDGEQKELYIIHTEYPISIIWVKQTIPHQLFIIEQEDPNTPDHIMANILRQAAVWFKANVPFDFN